MQKRYKGAFTDVFVEKYKVSPSELMESISTKHFGNVKKIGLDRLLKEELEKRNIEADGDFYKALIEAIADSNVKLPENQKLNVDFITFEIPNVDVSQPKSKGVLEDFKEIVSTDDLRPAMMGVYVSKEGYLVGTDAHILVKYKTNDFNEYEDKIIDLKKYIGTKGKAIDFIDAKYPNFDAVIPQDNEHKYKGLNTYAFYNFCKSAINVQKQTTITNFSIALKMHNEVYSLSPILFSELLNFALSKGFDSFELEVSDSKSRALVLKFENGSVGLIMPIMKTDDSQGSAPYTLEEVQEIFGKGKSTTKTRTTTTRKEQSKSSQKTEAYRKFEGSIEDATYIPRREIRSVELINGEILSQNEIIDGIYRAKKKFEVGGVVERYDNPLFNQGMQGELSGFGTSSPMSVFANGGTTDPHKFNQDTLMSNGGSMSVIEQLLKKYNAPQNKVDETSEWLKKEWEGKNVDDYVMYSDKYGKGGKTASIGDSGIITDKHSMFLGKMALITGDLGNMYEVRVGERTTIVKKNGINIISDEYAKGGMVVHGLQVGDEIVREAKGSNVIEVKSKDEKLYYINLNSGKRIPSSEYTMENAEGKHKGFFEMGNGGEVAFALARTMGRDNQNWEAELKQYAGKDYKSLTPREKEEIIADMQKVWDRNTHFAKGGEVAKDFAFDTDGDYEDRDLEEKKIDILRKKIDFDSVRGAIDYRKKENNTNLRFFKNGELVMTIQGNYDEDFDGVNARINAFGYINFMNYHPNDGFGGLNMPKFEREVNRVFQEFDEETKSTKFAKGGEVEITNETIYRGGLGSVQDNILAKGGLLKKVKSISKKAIKKAKPIAKKIVRKSKKLGAEAVKSAKIGFDALANKVAKSYEGKKVKPQYQVEYGKTYSKEEAKEVGQKVSAKVYRQQLGKRKITRKLQNKTK